MRTFITLALFALSAPLLAAEAQIGGRVVDAAGTPLAGAHVYLAESLPLHGVSSVCPSCYRQCGRHVDTNANGQFMIRDIDPQLRVRLLALTEEREPQYSSFVAPNANVTLTLAPRTPADEPFLIRGRVVDPKGKPVLGAEVTPSGVYTNRRTIVYGAYPGLQLLSVTNARGEFALRIPSDSRQLDVRVRAPGYAPVVERFLIPGAPRTIPLFFGAAIHGRIVHDGKPLGGVRVKLVQLDRNSRSFLGPEEIGTDDEGRFTLTNLGVGVPYVLSVAMDVAPLAAPEKIVTTGGDLSAVDAGTIALTTGCRIAGHAPPHTLVTLSRDAAADSRVVESGDDGSFVFDGVPPDKVTLRAGRARRGVTVTGDRDVTDIVLRIE